MPQPLTGLNIYSPVISASPSAGDPALAAVVRSNLQVLLNDAVYLNTQLSHQVGDDRGKTSTVTGDIILNDGGGSWVFNLPVTMSGGVDFTGANTVTFHSGATLDVQSVANFHNDVTIGSTGTDQCRINADTNVYGVFTTHTDTNIGTDAGDAITIAGTLTATEDSTFESDVEIQGDLFVQGGGSSNNQIHGTTEFFAPVILRGNTTIGDSSTDEHEVNGDITANNNASVGGDLEVDGDLIVNGGGAANNQIHGTTQFYSAVLINGDTTVGNNSSDAVTFNAQLSGGLAMGANGRVLSSIAVLPLGTPQALTLASPRCIIANSSGGAPVSGAWTIDDTGMLPGDGFEIWSNAAATSALTLSISGTSLSATLTSTGISSSHAPKSFIRAVRFGSNSTDWYFLVNNQ